MKKINLKFSVFHFALFIILCQGCMPDSLTKWEKGNPATPAVATSSTSSTSSSPSDPPDLTTLTTFQVKNITEKSTSYHLHKYGQSNISAACEISASDLTDGDTLLTDDTNDILCWLEAEEMQLYFSGADFQINAPAGYCEYVQVKPYYFWNAPPINSNRIETFVTCDDNSSATCLAAGGASAGSPNLTCAGDYTASGGPNCDEGSIQLNTTTVVALSTVTTNSTTVCGGKRTNCFGGPGVDFSVSVDGFPVPVDYLAYLGQSINYSVTAPGPSGKGYFTNHYIANYTSVFATGDYTYDYTTIASATGLERFSDNNDVDNTNPEEEDKAVDPLKRADIGATLPAYRVRPFYEFSCLNYSHELKGRIRLQIREWNQNFRTPVASFDEVNRSAPARMLKHSANSTDYETSGVGYWNDVGNWDNPISFGNLAPYVLVPAIPLAADVTENGFSFPYLGF